MKVYLLKGGKKISKKKTVSKRDERNPIFNEAMIFSVPANALCVSMFSSDLSLCALCVSMFGRVLSLYALCVSMFGRVLSLCALCVSIYFKSFIS